MAPFSLSAIQLPEKIFFVFMICLVSPMSKTPSCLSQTNQERGQLHIDKIEHCIQDVKLLMTKNYLMLHYNKTEVLHFRFRFDKGNRTSYITAGDAQVNVVSTALDLGVVLDSLMSMKSNICRSASFAIMKIRNIRRFQKQANP